MTRSNLWEALDLIVRRIEGGQWGSWEVEMCAREALAQYHFDQNKAELSDGNTMHKSDHCTGCEMPQCLDAGSCQHPSVNPNCEKFDMGGENPVAVVDASDDGWFASILPDVSVKLGQLLYTRPQASAAVPEGFVLVPASLVEKARQAVFLEHMEEICDLLAASQPESGK